MKQFLYVAVLLFFTLICTSVRSQISVYSGFGISGVKENIHRFNPKSDWSLQAGALATFRPFQHIKALTFGPQISIVRTGYILESDNKTYGYAFWYQSLALAFGYQPVSFVRLRAGGYGAFMFDTNIKHVRKTYNARDAGVTASISFFESKHLNLFIEGRQSLKPLLDYIEFDERGNFVRPIHDLYNVSLNFMVKVNIGSKPIGF